MPVELPTLLTTLYLGTFSLTTTCCCSSRATTTISSRQKPFYLTIIESAKIVLPLCQISQLYLNGHAAYEVLFFPVPFFIIGRIPMFQHRSEPDHRGVAL